MPEKPITAAEAMELASATNTEMREFAAKLVEHERTCGSRWGETRDALARLTLAQEVNRKRWEKLAWMVGACLLALTVASLTGS